jgi:hypothetical protein
MIVSYLGMTVCLFAISIITFFQDYRNPLPLPQGKPPLPPSSVFSPSPPSGVRWLLQLLQATRS